MLRLAFDFIITWRETRTRPNAYSLPDDGKGRYRRKGTTFKNLCNLIVTESLSVLQRSATST